MVKESVIGLRNSCIFRETFNSVNDVISNGGVATAVTFANGVGTFNGTSSKINYGNLSFLNNITSLSINCKIKTTDDKCQILNKWGPSLNRTFIVRIDDEGYVEFITYGVGIVTSKSSIKINDGKYHSLVFIYDGTKQYIYIDGSKDKEDNQTGTLRNDFLGLHIGVDNYSNTRFLDGSIDLVEIYPRVLSAEEVKMLYDETLHTSVSNKAGYAKLIYSAFDSTVDGWGSQSSTNSWYGVDTDGIGRVGCFKVVSNSTLNSAAYYDTLFPSLLNKTTKVSFDIYIPTTNTKTADVLISFTGGKQIYSSRQNVVTGTWHHVEYVLNHTVASQKLYIYMCNSLGGRIDIAVGDIIYIDNVNWDIITNSELVPILEYDFVKNKSAYNKVEYGKKLIDNNHNFSTGWYTSGGGVVNSSNSFSMASFGGIVCSPLITSGKVYYLKLAGITTSSSLRLRDNSVNNDYLTVSGTFDAETIITSIGTGLYISGGVGSTTITQFKLYEINNSNQTLTDCTFGQQGLICNGSTTKLDTGSTADLTGDKTFEAIINPVSKGENDAGRIIDNNNFLVYVYLSNRIYCTSVGGGTVASSLTNSVNYTSPFYCVVTRSSTGITNFYIDGVLSGTANQSSGTPVTGTTNIIIGNRSAGDRTFNGAIKVVNAYDGIMTLSQIQKRYNMYKSRGYLQ